MKLTIEHLAPYLPYGLKIIAKQNEIYSSQNIFILKGIVKENIYLSQLTYPTDIFVCKPILRPLSDLTKDIDLGFVPMIKLIELQETNFFSKDPLIKNCSVNFKVNVIDCKTNVYLDKHIEHTVRYTQETSNMGTLVNSFTYAEHFNRFSKRDDTRQITLGIGHQLELFQKLFEWHFDVFRLIEAGLAIDINTLNKG